MHGYVDGFHCFYEGCGVGMRDLEGRMLLEFCTIFFHNSLYVWTCSKPLHFGLGYGRDILLLFQCITDLF